MLNKVLSSKRSTKNNMKGVEEEDGVVAEEVEAEAHRSVAVP